MSQYLAVVQGMPKTVEARLNKIGHTFIWDNEGKPTINRATLKAPIAKGGKKVVNITDRNEAIELIWIANYLKPGPNRPLWALFADAIIAHHAQTNPVAKPAAKLNIFLQTWKPTSKKLPWRLKEMLRIAKKYNVRLEALSLPQRIKNDLPIWFHLG
ncbi:hypothetical protein BDZ94DRAFT_1180582, partial [Collybia nuda]